jgi:anion transporter
MEIATQVNAPPPWTPAAAPSRRRPVVRLAAAALGVVAVVALVFTRDGLSTDGKLTLLVFALAVGAWMFTGLDDTFVALAAALALVLAGALRGDELFGALGGTTIWLLIAAFVLAAGIGATGLPARVAVAVVGRARGVRQLVHLVTAAVILTAFAVPATSGRAALALPVFLALAKGLAGRPRVVRALSLLFPTVILLSAIATLLGAGAHLITSHLLLTATGAGIGFGQWLLLGLPLAVVSSHLAAELVLLLCTRRTDRSGPLWIDRESLAHLTNAPRGPLTPAERRALAVLAAASAAWLTEPWHGVPAAVVALAAALVITSPRVGTVGLNPALAGVPWSLLVFMAATAALGTALTGSGAATWLAGSMTGFGGPDVVFLAAVVVVSTVAHLAVQSRSARSSVLIPIVIPLATGFGMDPAAVAFASTAAAGFCHTLPSSAKPVAIFAGTPPGVPTYTKTDLLRLSAFLAPLSAGLVLVFALTVWPHLGLSLH